ncbi:MAG: bifunctional 5,10-methylenetetrahydrofolate dehydrogenase/5,10-methenyltetrahydrofolate cyclohydrolase [Alphaproteobacteria bacterium]|nr:MAG: bifunctional 5,10-methylenetetrahydrofolate dehydrogenase/5,10-methenyltetrahydrofolate cyclohydrolase [Alphaproteobacteria bacterium]
MHVFKNDGVTKIYRGEPLRDHLLEQVRTALHGLNIHVCVVQVGDNPASNTYVARKLDACAKVGIDARVLKLDADDGEANLHALVRQLAVEDEVRSIIVQTPLPAGWDVQAALDLVPAHKDIDGLSRAGMDLRRSGNPAALLPATPLGVMRMLDALKVGIEARKICVIGKGMVVGAPLREMLKAAGAEVVGIEKHTPGPDLLARECDVLIAAAGAPGLVTEAWVKPGAIVIDVGITRVDGKLRGDVDRARIEGIAGVVTPVPGGVGPMTVASLLTNIADATCLQLGRPKPRWTVDDMERGAE